MSTTTSTPATRTKLIGFPDPVNEVSARLVATGVFTMAVITIAFDVRWLTLVLAYGFIARVLTGPKLSPLGQLVTRVITPRVPFKEKLVSGPPKRFAQLIGATFTVTAATLTYGFDQFTAAKAVLGLIVIAASLEAFAGYCLGCESLRHRDAARLGARGGLRALQRPVGHVQVECVQGPRRGASVTDEAASRPGRDPRALARYLAAGVVIAAFIALAGLAIAASRSSFSIGLPAAADQAQAPTAETLPGPPALTLSSTPTPAAVSAAAPTAVAAAISSEPPVTTTTLAAPPDLASPNVAGKPCPAFGLSAPTDVGGLQSLIALVPLFGSFSPEAFALLPAFEPGFSALGPLFPVFQKGLDGAAPLLTAITPAVQQLSSAGFDALAPLYGSQREAVLAAEKQLAGQLAPIVKQLANAPGSECLVALEGVLASAVR